MTTTVSHKVTAIGKRVLAQAAISATVMTGLHFASIADLPPARWIFGPGGSAQTSLADASDAPVETAGAVPPVRVVALPLRSVPASVPAGPPAPAAASAGAGAEDMSPQPEPRIATLVPAKAASCGAGCAPPLRTVAHPTPRPVTPGTFAERPHVPADAPASAALPGPDAWRDMADRPMQVAESIPEPDDIPMPPSAEETSSFVFADLIPGRQMVMQGVSFVGNQARDVVAGAASGALDLVRR